MWEKCVSIVIYNDTLKSHLQNSRNAHKLFTSIIYKCDLGCLAEGSAIFTKCKTTTLMLSARAINSIISNYYSVPSSMEYEEYLVKCFKQKQKKKQTNEKRKERKSRKWTSTSTCVRTVHLAVVCKVTSSYGIGRPQPGSQRCHSFCPANTTVRLWMVPI